MYVVSNIGATVQLHMCCGDIVNWSLKQISTDDSAHNSCCGENTNSDDSCCEDKDIDIKLDDPQIIASIDYLFQSNLTSSQIFYCDFNHFLQPLEQTNTLQTFPQPPPGKAEDIGLFLFYKKLKVYC